MGIASTTPIGLKYWDGDNWIWCQYLRTLKKFDRVRKQVPSFNNSLTELYSAANDPRPQMIPRPEVITKLDRKWSPM